MSSNELSRADVLINRRETLFQGFYRVDKFWLQHRHFGGSMGREITREMFVRPPAVGVLIYDVKTDEVLLIEQFRVGAIEDQHPWQYEVVAGLVEPGEALEEVARRETLEEAGVVIADMEFVFEFMPSAGGSDERFTLYVAPADLSRAGGVHGVPEEGENIRVNVMGLKQALQLVSSGRINNAPCMLALQWLALNKAHVVSKWPR